MVLEVKIKKIAALLALAVLAACGGGHAPSASPARHAYSRPIGHVWAWHLHHGKVLGKRDLGTGAVTNVGVLAMANDAFWAAPSGAAINTLALQKYVATGTGVTAASQQDIELGTWDSVSPVTGTQSLVSGTNSQAYRVVATVNYSGTEAVTEFGLFDSPTISATTGSPFTAGTSTTGTLTGTPYTASTGTVQGEQQLIFVDTSKSCYGLVLSNTTSTVTVPAWYSNSTGVPCVSPVNADLLQIRPVMLDHKVFSAINVISGDSIQFTYTITLQSGG